MTAKEYALTDLPNIDAIASPAGVVAEATAEPTGGGLDAAPTTPAPAAAGKKAKVELTPREKLQKQIEQAQARIIKDTAFVAEATAKLNVIDTLGSVDVGYGVTIKVGRAETTREVHGVVTGVDRTKANDPRYKVYYGEGFDAEIVVIQQHQILAAVAPQA